MSTASISPGIPTTNQEPSLSEPQRIVNVFFAPTKTFADIRRSSRWWAPFLIGCLLSYLLTFAVATKVGWNQAAENTMKLRPKQYERIESLPAEQQTIAMGRVATTLKAFSYGSPVVLLLFYAIFAGVLLATFNFGVGTEVKYAQALAILFYSGLVIGFKKGLLGPITLFAGLNAESFNFDNFVGSNPAYYMSATDTTPWLYNLLSYLDLFTIWTFILIGIGFAVVGRKKISTGVTVMAAWYVVVVLVTTGWTALMS